MPQDDAEALRANAQPVEVRGVGAQVHSVSPGEHGDHTILCRRVWPDQLNEPGQGSFKGRNKGFKPKTKSKRRKLIRGPSLCTKIQSPGSNATH